MQRDPNAGVQDERGALQIERFAQRLTQRFVGREEDVHARVDHRRARPVSVFDHESRPSAAVAKISPPGSYDRQSNIFAEGQSTVIRKHCG